MSDTIRTVKTDDGVAIPVKVWIVDDDGDVTATKVTSVRVSDGVLLIEIEANG